MSTNSTANLGLHSWAPEDDFLRSEMNDNFTAIDTAVGAHTGSSAIHVTAADRTAWNGKVDVVIGSYTATGNPKDIALGFRPRALILVNKNAQTMSNPNTIGQPGGVLTAANGSNSYLYIALTDTGFHVSSLASSADNSPFSYLAIP